MKAEYDIQMKYEMALRSANDEAWTKMNLGEKLQTMQNIENERACCVGRVPARVICEEMDILQSGEYRSQENTIVLSQAELDTDLNESLNTLFHEGQHATQEHMLDSINLETATEQDIANVISLNMPLKEDASFEEYYYSIPEVNARQVAEELQNHMSYEQQMVREVDSYMSGIQTQNQILETFDYPAIEIAEALESDISLSQNVSQDMDVSFGINEGE